MTISPRLIVVSALAVAAAYFCSTLIPGADTANMAVPAAITALVSLRPHRHQVIKEGGLQLLGTAIGAGVGLLVATVSPWAALTLAAVVVVAFTTSRVLRLPLETGAYPMAITSILVVGIHLTTEGALSRAIGVLIGAVVATIASLLLNHRSASETLEEDIEELLNSASNLLGDMADGTRGGAPTTRVWFERARDLRDESLRLASEYEDLQSASRWMMSDGDEIATLRKRVDMASTITARSLSIAADLNHMHEAEAFTMPSAAVEPLARLLEQASEDLSTADSPEAEAIHGLIGAAEDTQEMIMLTGLVGHTGRIIRAGEN